ncbi:hypothetical protein JZ751_020367, partial [Albula glossodonta]
MNKGSHGEGVLELACWTEVGTLGSSDGEARTMAATVLDCNHQRISQVRPSQPDPIPPVLPPYPLPFPQLLLSFLFFSVVSAEVVFTFAAVSASAQECARLQLTFADLHEAHDDDEAEGEQLGGGEGVLHP